MHNRGAALTRGTFRPRPVMPERSRETGDIRADCAVYALRRYLPEPKQPSAASDSTTRRPLLSVMFASAHKHPPLTPSPNATLSNPENSASSHPPYDLITRSPYHPRHTVSARFAILSIRAATPTSTGKRNSAIAAPCPRLPPSIPLKYAQVASTCVESKGPPRVRMKTTIRSVNVQTRP